MKKSLLSSAMLASVTLFAVDHDFSLGMNFNTGVFRPVSLELSYLNSHDLQDYGKAFIGVFAQSHGGKNYHAESTFGYRMLSTNLFAMGLNYTHEMSNTFGFFNHAASPGVEFLFSDFSLSLSHHIPMDSAVTDSKCNYSFYRASVATLSIPVSQKWDISFSPYYVHKKDQLGIEASGAYSVTDNMRVSVIPFYASETDRGVAFSFGFDFGSSVDKKNKPVDKFHRFFYDVDAVDGPEKV